MVSPASGMNGRMMSSPGVSMDAMTLNAASFDSGQEILNNSDTQQQFLNHYQQDKFGENFKNLSLDKQARFNEGIMNQVNHNPNAAGNMLNEFRGGGDTNDQITL